MMRNNTSFLLRLTSAVCLCLAVVPATAQECTETLLTFDLHQEVSGLASYLANTIDEMERTIQQHEIVLDDSEESLKNQRVLDNLFHSLRQASSKIESCQNGLAEDAAANAVMEQASTNKNSAEYYLNKASALTFTKITIDFLSTTLDNASSILGLVCKPGNDGNKCRQSVNPVRLGLTIAEQAADTVSFGLALGIASNQKKAVAAAPSGGGDKPGRSSSSKGKGSSRRLHRRQYNHHH